jgi:hypothetical protein
MEQIFFSLLRLLLLTRAQYTLQQQNILGVEYYNKKNQHLILTLLLTIVLYLLVFMFVFEKNNKNIIL